MSDSEDDPDYLPPEEKGSPSSDDEPHAKRARIDPQVSEEESIEAKKTREALWQQFQASVGQPSEGSQAKTPKLVTIEKRFRYAGEDVIEVKEVPEDSDEAKKWPLWRGSVTGGIISPVSRQTEIPTAGPSSSADVPSSSRNTGTAKPAAGKRPGPRRPKTVLAALPKTQSAKKLTTLDKSAMDWRAHVEGEKPDLKDELVANRRGGGYLEKVEFLQRVGERKEEALEASKASSKRRR